MIKSHQQSDSVAAQGQWVKPEIVSFKPVEAAEGINPGSGDGVVNQTA